MFGEHATKQVVAAASKRVPGSNGVAVVDGSSLFFREEKQLSHK